MAKLRAVECREFIKAVVEKAQITIHVEPEAKAKHSGIVVV